MKSNSSSSQQSNSRKQARQDDERVEALRPEAERLLEMRNEIDQLDGEIAALLSRRLSLAAEVAEVKRLLNLPIKDANREFKILNRVMRFSGDPVISASLQQIYERILETSRLLQEQELTDQGDTRAVS